MTQDQSELGEQQVKASGIAAKLGVESVEATERQVDGKGDLGDIGGQTDSKELLVDVGGVQRTVKVAELVAAFNDRESVLSEKKALEQRLADLGNTQAIQALRERIDSLDSARRLKVLALLQGEDEEQDEDRETVARRALRGLPQEDDGEPLDQRVLAKLQYLERGLQALAARENQRISVEKRETLESQVQKEMAQYPLFKQDPVAASLARDSIMAMLAADQSATPDKVVRNAAGKLQELLNARRQEAAAELGVPRSMIQPGDRPALSANGLKTGATRRLAERLLSGKSPPT